MSANLPPAQNAESQQPPSHALFLPEDDELAQDHLLDDQQEYNGDQPSLTPSAAEAVANGAAAPRKRGRNSAASPSEEPVDPAARDADAYQKKRKENHVSNKFMLAGVNN